jgi:hypothetical protein
MKIEITEFQAQTILAAINARANIFERSTPHTPFALDELTRCNEVRIILSRELLDPCGTPRVADPGPLLPGLSD